MTTFVRKNVWTLPAGDPTLTAYAAAVQAMRAKGPTDPTSWTYQAGIHGSQCMHQSWYFVAWHRMYLCYFEQIVRGHVVADGGPADWALPYWNYDADGQNALPPAFRDETLPDGSANPLYAQRAANINAGHGLPQGPPRDHGVGMTSPAFGSARRIFTGAAELGGDTDPTLATFPGYAGTGRLEQTPHNDVHNKVGGLMLHPMTAAEDPVFWLHHANIDRIWWEWQATHANDPTDPSWTSQAFSFFDAGKSSVSPTCGEVVDIAKLGYTYDYALAPAAPAPGPSPALPDAAPLPAGAGAPVSWPPPWPLRPAVMPAVTTATGQAPRQLIGASPGPVRLVGDAARAEVTIDEQAATGLTTAPGAEQLQHRVFLDLEDIEAEANPGAVYGVYVNLPDAPSAEALATDHVGNLSTFGIERALRPAGDEHPHGYTLSMEVTDVLDSGAASGDWADGGTLTVTFEPSGLEPSEGEEAAPPISHPDLPITIGRVSVYYT